jgi:hypothetical protein
MHMLNQLLTVIGETGWGMRAIAKLTGLVVAGAIVLAIVLAIISALFNFASSGISSVESIAPTMGRTVSYGEYAPSDNRYDAEKSFAGASGGYSKDAMMTSEAFMPTPVPQSMPAVNGTRNSEKYERTGYSASYETRAFTDTCNAIEALKPLDYVLFDSANRGERTCWYQFRVEAAQADGVVAKLKALKPTDLSIDVQTVAQSIENTANRIDALKRQRATVQTTLTQAEKAYDEAIRAVRADGLKSLSSLVTDKLATVERLTNTLLSIDEQISSLEEGKKDTVDDTSYAHFSVSVSRITIVDWKSLGASWRYAVAHAISDASSVLSDILFDIPVFALRTLWFFASALVGIVVLVIFARAVRVITRRIWSWGEPRP